MISFVIHDLFKVCSSYNFLKHGVFLVTLLLASHLIVQWPENVICGMLVLWHVLSFIGS